MRQLSESTDTVLTDTLLTDTLPTDTLSTDVLSTDSVATDELPALSHRELLAELASREERTRLRRQELPEGVEGVSDGVLARCYEAEEDVVEELARRRRHAP
ncbi:hypothetical protein [Arsenicicoccus piscis]|uniref:Uncharacterized protein n=1 Tax=Arsenicicoccus piscis TaxID=673954 RepID=A0ABQ6HMW8_9MICO|nr:hypothetical protein [Arsenicicoccus piscis]GMA19780.1 hypothetical protein GCM10025862_18010 [Arsenicicoccus piscis]